MERLANGVGIGHGLVEYGPVEKARPNRFIEVRYSFDNGRRRDESLEDPCSMWGSDQRQAFE